MMNAILLLADSTNQPAWYAFRATDIVMVFAVLAAPWIAVHIQRRLDIAKEKRARKHAIFRTLMATRAARVSADHVAALNMIDIEFYGEAKSGRQKQSPVDAKVVAAWRVYLDSLNFGQPNDPGFDARIEQSREKFVDLLFEVSKALGYNFDRVLLKQGVYTPVAHGEFEVQDRLIRQGLTRILSGEAALGVTAILPDEALKQQQKIQADLGKVLSGKQPLTVKMAATPNGTGG